MINFPDRHTMRVWAGSGPALHTGERPSGGAIRRRARSVTRKAHMIASLQKIIHKCDADFTLPIYRICRSSAVAATKSGETDEIQLVATCAFGLRHVISRHFPRYTALYGKYLASVCAGASAVDCQPEHLHRQRRGSHIHCYIHDWT